MAKIMVRQYTNITVGYGVKYFTMARMLQSKNLQSKNKQWARIRTVKQGWTVKQGRSVKLMVTVIEQSFVILIWYQYMVCDLINILLVQLQTYELTTRCYQSFGNRCDSACHDGHLLGRSSKDGQSVQMMVFKAQLRAWERLFFQSSSSRLQLRCSLFIFLSFSC